jgi:hypothetical protein
VKKLICDKCSNDTFWMDDPVIDAYPGSYKYTYMCRNCRNEVRDFERVEPTDAGVVLFK